MAQLLLSIHCNTLLHIIISNMNIGKVKFFNDAKGFGFIETEESDKDHFVHVSGLVDEIKEGDSVEFELEEGKRGPSAVKVRVL